MALRLRRDNATRTSAQAWSDLRRAARGGKFLTPVKWIPQTTLMHRAQLWTVCGFWACATAALLGFCEIGDGRTGHNFGGVGGGRPLWLGHETTTTTHRYVEANLAMKEKALARIQEPDTKMSRYQPPDDLTKFLQAL